MLVAALQGLAAAQFNIALKYYIGQGVAQNYVRAHMWWNLAAVRDAEGAIYRLMVEEKITQQQIAEVQKLAKECQASNYKNCD